jgi:plasmid replication initiation protein
MGVTLISFYEIVKGKGLLKVTVHASLIPYFSNLLNEPRVTKINLNNALSLKSTYSQRLYEFCSQYQDTGWWKISVEDLRAKLELEGKFAQWSNFKDRVLETAQKELQKKSDIYFTYKTRKTGKQITHLDFKIIKRDATISAQESIYIM